MKKAGFLGALLVVVALLAVNPVHAQARDTASPDDVAAEWATRDQQRSEISTLTGGVGLLHIQHAQGGSAGQFRIGFVAQDMSAGFLCSHRYPCQDPAAAGATLTHDKNHYIGGNLILSVDVTNWLEPYLSTSVHSNSSSASRPTLLQVLGDTTLGAKVHAPLNKVFFVGGAADLWLVDAAGSVGPDGAGTSASARLRAIGTADLRVAARAAPLRFSVNAQYVFDNTGRAVASTESARAAPITRVERWGLGINRVDHVDLGVGGEVFAAEQKVSPFAEYNIMIPVNRQNYRCRTNNPSGDGCLAYEAILPSSLTVGVRAFPYKSGFSLTAAIDIGITGVHRFIEEVRPTPPWMLYLGVGWAFDTKDRPPTIIERVVEKPVVCPVVEQANEGPNQINSIGLLLKKRPEHANVTLGPSEILIKKPIQFEPDKAAFLPESSDILTEISDVLINNPRIRKVEVQGHTDNTEAPDHAKILSADRASAVIAWLTAHGVSPERMTPRGFGQDKPIVPNVTRANRAKNRRIQFVIVEQDAVSPELPAATR
ncbi:MAG: OmpA family protein [Polyangiaceae bacterium]|nr:OmpA family protein [Polyangiaceae bacterium]